MGSSLRHLASVVRGALLLVLAGAGVVGCSAISRCGRAPPVDAPVVLGSVILQSKRRSRTAWPHRWPRGRKFLPPAPTRSRSSRFPGGWRAAPFTAGVLTGWTKSGTRPMFDQVSGISSGSLIGAFAFLGPQYDEKMRSLILSLHTSDLIRFHPLCCMVRDGSLGSSKPAERLLGTIFDEGFLADLRKAHAEGRRFFVGTMNLETKRLAIWDVGAIASSGRADAGDLVRKVLLAAISWPGTVPPVEFDVEVDGRCYHEQHCDAGSVAMTFVRFGALPGWPEAGAPARMGWLAGSDLYVLASRKLYSDPMPVRQRALCRMAPCISAIFEAHAGRHIPAVFALRGLRDALPSPQRAARVPIRTTEFWQPVSQGSMPVIRDRTSNERPWSLLAAHSSRRRAG